MDRPCAVPAIVILAVKHEKVLYQSTQLNQPAAIWLAVSHVFSQAHIEGGNFTMFTVRKVLASQFESMAHLLQFASNLTAYHVPDRKQKKDCKKRKDLKTRKGRKERKDRKGQVLAATSPHLHADTASAEC